MCTHTLTYEITKVARHDIKSKRKKSITTSNDWGRSVEPTLLETGVKELYGCKKQIFYVNNPTKSEVTKLANWFRFELKLLCSTYSIAYGFAYECVSV